MVDSAHWYPMSKFDIYIPHITFNLTVFLLYSLPQCPENNLQLNVNETLRDTAQVLSKFNSIVLARVFSHDDVKVLRDSGNTL